jgi:hypothetical protein
MVPDQRTIARAASRAVRRGEAVDDPRAAALAIATARRVQATPTWTWSVVLPAAVLGVLGVLIGGFALVWYLVTVVPALATEPHRARRRKDRALAAEAANLALVDPS